MVFNCRKLLLSTAAFPILISFSGAAGTELYGTLGKKSLSSNENPIIVKDNITIPPNGRMIIHKGCELFFVPNTGIIVEGSLSIEGTKTNPVVFTSINDSLSPEKNNPTARPSDWNGIVINKQSQRVVFKNFAVKYSHYGIQSFNEDMSLENGSFFGNGQFNVTLNNMVMPVTENLSYNYEKQGRALKNTQSNVTWFLPSAKAATVTGGAAICLMAYCLHQKSEYATLYRNSQSQIERKDYYEKQKPFSRNAILSGIAGAVMLSAGGAFFVLDYSQKNRKNCSLYPFFGAENGILACFDL
jgi:hypothetical protein